MSVKYRAGARPLFTVTKPDICELFLDTLVMVNFDYFRPFKNRWNAKMAYFFKDNGQINIPTCCKELKFMRGSEKPCEGKSSEEQGGPLKNATNKCK